MTGGRVTIDGVDVRELDARAPALAGRHRVRGADAVLDERPREPHPRPRRRHATPRSSEALEIAQAGFVHDLPWGLDTRIGEQGMSLSGGQRQRLALARAVLAQPSILVLDDTLSALDVHTEKLVEEALRRVLADTTGLIVAHRASTVLLADRVALLQDGTITHVGDHRELLATVPAYRDLLGRRRDADLEGACLHDRHRHDADPATDDRPGAGSPPTRSTPTSCRRMTSARLAGALAPAAARAAAALRQRRSSG